ncbi:MAG: acetylserotonin O-methyltransferase, partial [Actinomycetota bacterium]|nr:acetylserotonin O-methyltransferase [Actinomycetota bacterium]
FTALAAEPLDVDEVAAKLRLGASRRAVSDFLDALVALGLLERDAGRYSNTPASDALLDEAKTSYAGGLGELLAARGYDLWATLTTALRTGDLHSQGQSRAKAASGSQNGTRRFVRAMTAGSMRAAQIMARQFPWDGYATFVDVGTAEGCLPVQLALARPHLSGWGLDLPAHRPFFESYVASFGLGDRLAFFAGNFLTDPLPATDVVVLGNILCILDPGDKRRVLERVHSHLPPGGALIVYGSLIDGRRSNSAALLTALGLSLSPGEKLLFSADTCSGWLRELGFSQVTTQPLDGPRTMVTGLK